MVYVAFVLASPRGKNILQDELAAKLIIKMNGYSDSPVDFSDYVWLLSFFLELRGSAKVAESDGSLILHRQTVCNRRYGSYDHKS